MQVCPPGRICPSSSPSLLRPGPGFHAPPSCSTVPKSRLGRPIRLKRCANPPCRSGKTEVKSGHPPAAGTKKPQALRERLAVFSGCDDPVHGAPGGIRTPDQWLRKPLLYPAELRAHLELAITDVAVLTATPATGRTGIVPNPCRHAYWFLPFPAAAPRKRSEPPPGCAGITSSAP